MKIPICICGDAPIITVADSAITISCEHCAGMSATARSLAGAAGLWERVVSDKESIRSPKLCVENKCYCRHLLVRRSGLPDYCRKYQKLIDRDDYRKPIRFERCSGVEIAEWARK